jgi:glycosyltransferase involved in cell wall biosynthesis
MAGRGTWVIISYDIERVATGAPPAVLVAADVSVVVPTHNRRSSLLRVLACLDGQRGVRIQTIVVVDGSQDGTLEALQQRADPDLIIVHHDVPVGVAAARNAGLARADCQYIGFVDDDDVWAPDRVVDAVSAMRVESASWSCCGAVYVDGRGAVTALHAPPASGWLREEVYRSNPLPGGGSGLIADRDLLNDAGGFSTGFKDLADWEMWIRLASRSPIASVPAFQIGYTLDDRCSSFTRPARCYEELGRLRRQYGFGEDGRPDYEPALWTRWMSGQHWRAGDRTGLARLWMKEALRTRDGLDVARFLAYAVLPRPALERGRQRYLRRSLRALDPALVAEAQAWMDAVGTEVPA